MTTRKSPARKAPAKKSTAKKAVTPDPVETDVSELAPGDQTADGTVSRWAKVKAEAAAIKAKRVAEGKRPEVFTEPYVIDAYTPALEIPYPYTVEQQLALVRTVATDGTIDPREITTILQGICGRTRWPAVYALIRDEEPEMLLALLQDLQEHFGAEVGVGAGNVPGKIPALISLVEQFGVQIDLDLLDRGLALTDFMLGEHSWSRLIDIIADLPISSRYQSALAMDEEVAAILAEQVDPDAPAPPPSFTGYSREIELATYQANLLQQLIYTLIAVNSTKSPARPSLLPTPKSALTVALEEREKREIDDLAHRFGVSD
ncbi:tail assembly chaperone [Gordonia phage Cafasso]|uniref:Tail assembly chaperone n=1 Tax=Gordonia phage Cafasso TaxID=2851095 RepID=A0AAE7SIA7_9CAUD|nr:tail assembly chaperone [Gordonia phage Cafasso]